MQGIEPRARGHYIVAITSVIITGNMESITGNSSFQGLMQVACSSCDSWKSHPDSSSLIINALGVGTSLDVGLTTHSHTEVTR